MKKYKRKMGVKFQTAVAKAIEQKIL